SVTGPNSGPRGSPNSILKWTESFDSVRIDFEGRFCPSIFVQNSSSVLCPLLFVPSRRCSPLFNHRREERRLASFRLAAAVAVLFVFNPLVVNDKACNAHGLYCVPLYDTLGAGAVESFRDFNCFC
ncbi:hypothetical protein LINPERPRIM_LOCUS39222, partial [Linum perenne]